MRLNRLEIPDHLSFSGMTSINQLAGPCGCGKTTKILEYIRTLSDIGENIIYIAPTIQLLEETRARLYEKYGIKMICLVSNYGNYPLNIVQSTINSVMTATNNGKTELGAVIGVTHKTFFSLPTNKNLRFWRVVVDEVPQFDSHASIKMPSSAHLFEKYINVSEFNEFLYIAKPKNKAEFNEFLKSPRDDLEDSLRHVLADINSGSKCVFVDRDSWDRIVVGGDIDRKRHHRNEVHFLTIIRPSALISHVVVGANIENSLLSVYARKLGIKSRPHSLSKDLRIASGRGGNVDIFYFSERLNSKHFGRQHLGEDGKDVVGAVDDAVLDIFGGEDFLYVSNNDRKSVLDDCGNVTRIGACSHGLNKYSGISNIYFCPALNRKPIHIRMLKALGFSDDEIWASTTGEAAYQCIMRTSLRNSEAKDPVRIAVFDRSTADYVSRLIPGSVVRRVEGVIDVVDALQPLTPAERARKSRGKKVRGSWFSVPMSQSSITPIEERDNSPSDSTVHAAKADSAVQSVEGNEHPPRVGNERRGHNTTIWTFCYHQKAYSEDEFFEVTETIPALVQDLRVAAKGIQETKDEGVMLIAAQFRKGCEAGVRRHENFVSSPAIVLDFDNGELSPEEFINIFNCSKRKHSFVLANSFSRCEDQPNRFRAILFYKEPAGTIEEHRAVYAYVVRVLEEHGFSEERAKLDRACKSPVQPYWVPCTNRHHPDWAMFMTFNTDARGLDRWGIRPKDHLGTYSEVRKFPPPISPGDGAAGDSKRIENLKAAILNAPDGRRKMVFHLVNEIVRCGGDPSIELRGFADHDAKLREHIADAIKSVMKPSGSKR